MVGMSCLTRWMKASIESENIPVPLFWLDRLIVSQMFPGRLSSWVFVGGVCDVVPERISGYRPLTISALSLFIVAILLKVHARVIAVR